MRAGERSARGLALIIFGFSRRACGPRRRSSPRYSLLKVPFIDKPSQTLSPTRPKSSRGGDMRVPQRQQCWPAHLEISFHFSEHFFQIFFLHLLFPSFTWYNFSAEFLPIKCRHGIKHVFVQIGRRLFESC